MTSEKGFLKLLMVHDQDGSIERIKRSTEMNEHLFDCEIQHTCSAEEVFNLVNSWHPGVVLLDAHLNDSNCFEILEELKGSSAAVIITSEFNSADIEKSAMEHGALGYHPIGEAVESVEELIGVMMELSKITSHEH